MRKLKSPLEIEALRKAAHLADAAMQAAMDAAAGAAGRGRADVLFSRGIPDASAWRR